jgi:hypothetical protein
MPFTKGPNDRRRIDREAMNRRDSEVAGMRRQGVPFRVIAERLNMSLGAVQKAVRRAQMVPVGELGPRAGDIDPADPDGWRQLNPVERYRFGMLTGRRVPAHDEDHSLCCLQYGLDPDWRPNGGHDRNGGHPWPPAERDDDW